MMTRQKAARDKNDGILIEACDLVVDRLYEGGRSGNAGDDRISKLLGVSNQGGFRYLGTPGTLNLIVITSNFADPDWPDQFDRQTGVLTYYGDNKKPGRSLHETPRRGNLLLREIFEYLHANPSLRQHVPPILAFRATGIWRDVEFLGLAVPGVEGMPQTEDLVAVWRTSGGKRFQNYRASFTILDVAAVSRTWIEQIRAGNAMTVDAPTDWRSWVDRGKYTPLTAEPTIEYRTKDEQLPSSPEETAIIRAIHEYYKDDPIGFERCATEIVKIMDANFIEFNLTRPSRDGGRDALGQYRIGYGPSSVLVDVALEAKCYSPSNSVGVRELSRLISRLRHRQVGVLVTTSYVAQQAYKEIKEDGHPIMIVCGVDIVRILRNNGIASVAQTRRWLDSLSD
jgi:hypothetical protein